MSAHSHSHGDGEDGGELKSAFPRSLGVTVIEIAGGLWTCRF
jgi:hypothetical protein